MKVCKFDHVEHKYTIDGEVVPSVTGLISEFGLSDQTWYGLQAKYRGTHVHTATQYYDEDDLDFDGLDPIVKPYVNAYIKFKSEIKGLIYTHIETSLFDSDNKFAGTFDRYGTLNGKTVLIDIKSGSMPKTVAVQLAGYKKLIACNQMDMPIEYYALVLKSNGSYKLNKIQLNDMLRADIFFNAMLAIKKAQRMYNNNIKEKE